MVMYRSNVLSYSLCLEITSETQKGEVTCPGDMLVSVRCLCCDLCIVYREKLRLSYLCKTALVC